MKKISFEKQKQWLKEHKREMRDLVWYTAGFAVAFGVCYMNYNPKKGLNKAGMFVGIDEDNPGMIKIVPYYTNKFGLKIQNVKHLFTDDQSKILMDTISEFSEKIKTE